MKLAIAVTEHRVDQTILHGDPQRLGNCFAACVATATGKALHEVPHFVEWGQYLHNGQQRDDEDTDRKCWWAMFVGYTIALGLHPVALQSIHDADADELVFVSGHPPAGSCTKCCTATPSYGTTPTHRAKASCRSTPTT